MTPQGTPAERALRGEPFRCGSCGGELSTMAHALRCRAHFVADLADLRAKLKKERATTKRLRAELAAARRAG
jgi:hypothetical protein